MVDWGVRFSGPVLGPRQSRRLFSSVLGMAHLRRFATDALCPAPELKVFLPPQRGYGMRSQWRFLMAAVLLGGTALLLHERNNGEVIVARPALRSFPKTIQDCNSTDFSIRPDVLDVLEP